jgi:hypothetical protein
MAFSFAFIHSFKKINYVHVIPLTSAWRRAVKFHTNYFNGTNKHNLTSIRNSEFKERRMKWKKVRIVNTLIQDDVSTDYSVDY